MRVVLSFRAGSLVFSARRDVSEKEARQCTAFLVKCGK
jgi:hypothetical protein